MDKPYVWFVHDSVNIKKLGILKPNFKYTRIYGLFGF